MQDNEVWENREYGRMNSFYSKVIQQAWVGTIGQTMTDDN